MKHVFLAGAAISITIAGSAFGAERPVEAPASPPHWIGPVSTSAVLSVAIGPTITRST
jgi:hypothetical protein